MRVIKIQVVTCHVTVRRVFVVVFTNYVVHLIIPYIIKKSTTKGPNHVYEIFTYDHAFIIFLGSYFLDVRIIRGLQLRDCMF